MSTQTIGRRVARGAATLVAAGLLAVGAAGCEPPPVPPTPRPPTNPTTTTTTTAPAPAPTELEVVYGQGLRVLLTYTVRCGPGTAASITPAVPGLDARRACATASAERRLLVEGPPPGRICAQRYYGPETARVTGHIEGTRVSRRFGRNDACAENDWLRVGQLVIRPSVMRQIG